jgi:hypothetical protein
MRDDAKDDQEQTEQTPKGFRVRVPSRAEFFGNLRKVTESDKPVEADVDEAPPHGDTLAD